MAYETIPRIDAEYLQKKWNESSRLTPRFFFSTDDVVKLQRSEKKIFHYMQYLQEPRSRVSNI